MTGRHHGSYHTRLVLGLLVLALVLLATAARAPRAAGGARASAPARADSAAALIALGDSVFHGRVGGALCTSCHGPDAKGLAALGPDLTDAAWLHGDGTVDAIASTIRAGVAKPKKSKTVMPPFGGTPLDAARLRAVATYVHSLSRRGG